MKNNNSIWGLLLAGCIFTLIGALLFIYSAPPLSSMGTTSAVITDKTSCTCKSSSGSGRHSESHGYRDSYEFAYEGNTYSGTENGCTCGMFFISKTGDSMRVFFDKNNPQNNQSLGDFLFSVIFFLIGISLIIGYTVIIVNKHKPPKERLLKT